MYIYVDIDDFFLNFILHYLPIKVNFILRKLFHSAQVKESSKRERESGILRIPSYMHTHTHPHIQIVPFIFFVQINGSYWTKQLLMYCLNSYRTFLLTNNNK